LLHYSKAIGENVEARFEKEVSTALTGVLLVLVDGGTPLNFAQVWWSRHFTAVKFGGRAVVTWCFIELKLKPILGPNFLSSSF